MKLRHNDTGHIFNGEYELRMAYPSVSFPPTLDQNALNFANVTVIREVPPPTFSLFERVDYDGVQLVDGEWIDTWSVHPKYDDPTEQATWETECLEMQWNTIRALRDQLLAETDYTDLPNTPITQTCRNNFIAYRQALRDVTTQTDPYNIVWPVKPTYEPQT